MGLDIYKNKMTYPQKIDTCSLLSSSVSYYYQTGASQLEAFDSGICHFDNSNIQKE